MFYFQETNKGYLLSEVISTLQKAIRRGDEDTALYFANELFDSNYAEYCWRRLQIISTEDVGLAEPNISANIHALYEFFHDQKKSKGKYPKSAKIFLFHAVILLCRAKKSRLIDWKLLKYIYKESYQRRGIPDYAFDKHTERGRKLGRGWEHFFNEASQLNNYAGSPEEDDLKQECFEIMTHPNGQQYLFEPEDEDNDYEMEDGKNGK